MEDDSRNSIVKSLKNEWSLFWESIAGEGDEENTDKLLPLESGTLRVLSLEDLRMITFDLSQNRKVLNQRLESLQKEIELNSAKLESLRLIGAPTEEILQRINELHDQGQRLTHELDELNKQLRVARNHEDRLRSDLVG